LSRVPDFWWFMDRVILPCLWRWTFWENLHRSCDSREGFDKSVIFMVKWATSCDLNVR
jgi:hypothetical protein